LYKDGANNSKALMTVATTRRKRMIKEIMVVKQWKKIVAFVPVYMLAIT